jgi:hypothetical protein
MLLPLTTRLLFLAKIIYSFQSYQHCQTYDFLFICLVSRLWINNFFSVGFLVPNTLIHVYCQQIHRISSLIIITMKDQI